MAVVETAGSTSGKFLLKNKPLIANSRFCALTTGAYGMDQSSSKSLYSSVYPFWLYKSPLSCFGSWDLIWFKTYFWISSLILPMKRPLKALAIFEIKLPWIEILIWFFGISRADDLTTKAGTTLPFESFWVVSPISTAKLTFDMDALTDPLHTKIHALYLKSEEWNPAPRSFTASFRPLLAGSVAIWTFFELSETKKVLSLRWPPFGRGRFPILTLLMAYMM